MSRREFLLRKIEIQEKEWANQVKYLRAKVSCFDSEKKQAMQKYVEHLNFKLQTIETQTQKIRSASAGVWENHGEKIVDCWEELVHNVDYVIANYVRIFNQ